MRISKYFTAGIMNKDADERSIPNGMYRHAENIRVTNSDGSNAGLVESIKGTTLLAYISNLFTLHPFTESKTIGVGKDTYSGCIYWLVWTDGDDYLVEFNTQTNTFSRVLQHNTVLNLDKDHLVSEIQVIRDSYSGNVYLSWTDAYNEPRFVNLERAKSWGLGNFVEDDILLIKQPPKYEPKTLLLSSPSTKENNIEEKFLAFAYRFKHLDGEYSALSSFSNYAFSPKPFNLDFATKENVGMVNQFNAVQISFNTGSKRVTDIDLVFKESGSNTIYKIQTFNKVKENWGNNTEQSFTFINDKVYSVLPEKELYRLYDSVPLKAKDMSIIDNRIAFHNITEGRNMVDKDGNKVDVRYKLNLIGDEIVAEEIPTFNAVTAIFHFEGISLDAGKRIVFKVSVSFPDYGAYYDGDFEYILSQDYASVLELANDEDFVSFIEDVWTDNFLNGYEIEMPENSEITLVSGFGILPTGLNNDIMYVRAPYMELRTDNTPNNPNDNDYDYDYLLFNFKNPTSAKIINNTTSTSLKSNRSYEVGLVYEDTKNRQSPTLVDNDNTLFVPISRSTFQNQIQVQLLNNPPAWADRYKFVLKANKFGHETLYSSIYYVDGVYRWVMLDGENKNKVSEGDVLIVKSDLDGPLLDLKKVKVIEIKQQEKGFLDQTIEEGEEASGQLAGLYMKIRPLGFDMGTSDSTNAFYLGYGSNYANTSPKFGSVVGGSFEPYSIIQGTVVSISISLRGIISGTTVNFQKEYVVQSNYSTYKEWFESEVQTFGDFGVQYLSDFGVNNEQSFFVQTKETNQSISLLWMVVPSGGLVIFETEPKELDVDIYYETGQTFDIVNGQHVGNTAAPFGQVGVFHNLNAFNCFVMGNGAESYKIKDGFNGNSLNIDLRPTTTTDDEYKERNLFSSFTWGGNYEEFTQYNSLNEFNRSTLNIKQLDDKYGGIQRGIAMENSLFFFQEDKVSQVLYRRRALFNQDGSANVGATDVDFGDQISFTGNYGISQNPESIAIDKKRIYFTDRKRGVPCRLSLDGIEEIPGYYYDSGNIRRETMHTWFKEIFRTSPQIKCFGVFDPEYDEYVLHINAVKNSAIIKKTLAYRQEAGNSGGWTTFFTYNPDMMVSLNGKLYGFENGNLYRFNDEAAQRNTFFGNTFPSKITGIFNDYPSEVKMFNALNIEGSEAWNMEFRTNLTNGRIYKNEFKEIEKEWYANFRKDETDSTKSLATQGIGVGESVSLNTGGGVITFSSPINTSVNVGDMLYMNNLDTYIGTITGINGNTITYNDATQTPLSGGFFFSQKNSRIEGSAIRGYYLEFDLSLSSEERIELYSVNAEISKSYP